MRRRLLIWIAVALQAGVLVWMAAGREWILATGRPAMLRTAPIDPRDPLRGDFVRLDYSINHIEAARLRDGLVPSTLPPEGMPAGRTVYATTTTNPGRGLQVASVSDRYPASGPVLRGRLGQALTRHAGGAEITWGIETLFVEQGQGRIIEEERGRSDGIQVPLEVDLRIGGGGTAAIAGWQWSRLGIATEPLRQPRPAAMAPREQPPLQQVRLRFKNLGDRPLAVVDLPGHASFHLDTNANRWSASGWSWVTPAPPPAPTAADLQVIDPGGMWTTVLDLDDPRWQIQDGKGKRMAVNAAERWERFRFIYVAPSAATCAGLPGAASIWADEMVFPAFNVSGWVD